MTMNRTRLLSIAVFATMLFAGVATVFVETAADQAGAGQAPGRGRGVEAIQGYPADPNDVIQAIRGFKVEIVA